MKVELPNGIIVEGSEDECRRVIGDFMPDRTIARPDCPDNDKLYPNNSGPHWWEMPPAVPYCLCNSGILHVPEQLSKLY